MKQGMTLNEVIQYVTDTAANKADYIVPANKMSFNPESGALVFPSPDGGPVIGTMSKRADQQMAAWLGVPVEYVERMRAADMTGLASANLNAWLERRTPGEGRMVRTLSGRVRAVLSPRYSATLDNVNLAQAIVPVLADMAGDIDVASANVSDDFLHVKVVSRKLEREVKKGDVVRFGAVVRNSEVGLASWLIEPFVERLVCVNGMVVEDRTMRRRHVGSNEFNGEDVSSVLSDRAMNADATATVLKTRDVFRAALTDAKAADRIVEELATATGRTIRADDRVAFVERVAKQTRLTDEEGRAVLEHLLAGGDLTQYGVANAITRAAADVESYDRATMLERIGGRVVRLSSREWEAIDKQPMAA